MFQPETLIQSLGPRHTVAGLGAWLAGLMEARYCLTLGGVEVDPLVRTLPEDGLLLALAARGPQPALHTGAVAVEWRAQPPMQALADLVAGESAIAFDMALLDAERRHYGTYYECCLSLLRPGGVLVADRRGGNDPSAQAALQRLEQRLADDHRVRWVGLPPDGDLLLVQKR